VAQTLLQLASPTRISLLAMATHGRGGLRRIVLGSVTDKLVRTAQVPVLVVPPTRAARRAAPARAGGMAALGRAEILSFG
jgi:hypothetical protein